jgi:hypothetical protein
MCDSELILRRHRDAAGAARYGESAGELRDEGALGRLRGGNTYNWVVAAKGIDVGIHTTNWVL